MESFIRSKYESKRWALEGPPPDDPSVLDASGSPATPSTQPHPLSEQAAPSLSNSATRSTRTTTPVSVAVPRQQQTHQLISANYANRLTPLGASQSAFLPPPEPAPRLQAKAPENDLFSLDFNAPVPAAPVPEPKKDVKQDILSLFSSNPVAAASPVQTAPTQSLTWQGNVPQQQPAATSMIGSSGTGMWGASSGWSGAVPVIPAQPNIWNSATTTQDRKTHV